MNGANELQIRRTQRASTELTSRCWPTRPLFASVGRRARTPHCRDWPAAAGWHHQSSSGAVRRRRYRIWFDLGAAFGRYGELRVGPHYERVRAFRRRLRRWRDRRARSIPVFTSMPWSTSVIRRPRLRAPGYRVEASLLRALSSFGATSTFSRHQWSSEYAHTIGANTVDLRSNLAGCTARRHRRIRISNWADSCNCRFAGGQKCAAIRVSLARAMVFRRSATCPRFGRGIYAGGSLEVGRIDSPNNDCHAGAFLFGGSPVPWARNLLGPLYVGYGHATGNRRSAICSSGRP